MQTYVCGSFIFHHLLRAYLVSNCSLDSMDLNSGDIQVTYCIMLRSILFYIFSSSLICKIDTHTPFNDFIIPIVCIKYSSTSSFFMFKNEVGMVRRKKDYFLPLGKKKRKKIGLVRDSNPGPLAPEARIIPLDQQASTTYGRRSFLLNIFKGMGLIGQELRSLSST